MSSNNHAKAIGLADHYSGIVGLGVLHFFTASHDPQEIRIDLLLFLLTWGLSLSYGVTNYFSAVQLVALTISDFLAGICRSA